MPIYVGYESSDEYSNRQIFQLNQDGHMIFQSGCPPCKFQKNGQLWGNPIYAWEKHKKTNFKWWKQRFKKLFEMVDIIRLDHFIGYDRYYRIPVKDKTAINGEWVEAIGKELFRSLMENDFDFNVIVEDLASPEFESLGGAKITQNYDVKVFVSVKGTNYENAYMLALNILGEISKSLFL